MSNDRFYSAIVLGVWVATQSVRAQPDFGHGPDTRVHDPSTIVRCGADFWCFFTGNGVRSTHSTNLLDWQSGPPVFTNIPDWTREAAPGQRGHFWAPDIMRLGDRHLLYYSVSSWGKNTSAIGLATNATLDPQDTAYRWGDAGVIIRSGATNDFNAIDPAVTLDADGRLWLAFGSFWSGIKLVELDPVTGLRIAPGSPLYSIAFHESIEAPYLHHHANHYFLFVNWGMCCRGTNSTYEIRVGRSARITGPYRDRDGNDLLNGGGTLLLGSRGREVGPGHAGILTLGKSDWLTFHYYDRDRSGRPALGRRRLHWDPEGWPRVE